MRLGVARPAAHPAPNVGRYDPPGHLDRRRLTVVPPGQGAPGQCQKPPERVAAGREDRGALPSIHDRPGNPGGADCVIYLSV